MYLYFSCSQCTNTIYKVDNTSNVLREVDVRKYLRLAHFCGIGRDRNLPGRLLCGRASLIAGSALTNAAKSTKASGTNII